ncbi:hypothetical protein LJC12_05390, partial [Odoribacter sp. OttesenSCG-928-J03]|nr:hypothetical protein [Odoribacter sp. OttesenSCG-928-J03]
VVIVVANLLWFVFTPERITPIVREQAGKYVSCTSEIGSVELTLFSTFPNFGLKVDRVTLVNPQAGAPCDTLLDVGQLTCVVDIEAFWKRKELIITGVRLIDGKICAFVDETGKANFDVLSLDSSAESNETDAGFTLDYIDVSDVSLKNIDINYVDRVLKMDAGINQLSAQIKASVKDKLIQAAVSTEPFGISLDYEGQCLEIADLATTATALLDDDSLRVKVGMKPFDISYRYYGETYLKNAKLKLNALADVILSRQFVRLNTCTASLNDLSIALNGTVENNMTNGNIETDLSYALNSWNIKDVLALVPASFSSYLEGIEADGKLTSTGRVKGIYNELQMPLLDLNVLMEEGSVRYAELPFPLHGIKGDLHIYTDLKDDKASYVQVNELNVKTPQSTIKTRGKLNRLFSDIRVNLETEAGLNLAEFNDLIPAELKTVMQGRVTGNIKSDLTMSQIERMALEKMKLSGSLSLSDLDVVYDSISVKTDRSRVDFSLPNRTPSEAGMKFASLELASGALDVKMVDGVNASLYNSHIVLETSDIRDTTKIPSLRCAFELDHLSADMDTMHVSVAGPQGVASMAPRGRKSDLPQLKVVYNSGELKANMGGDKVEAKKIDLSGNVTYNAKQDEIFLKWLPKGSIYLEEAVATMSMLAYPVEIPVVKMEFTPHEFVIDRTTVKLGDSDFNLSGKLSNILAHYRRDSILVGDFNFTSSNVDMLQLMSMTSGLGDEEEKPAAITNGEENTFTGPYMVPKKMDILLHTDIRQATLGEDTITAIKGDVRVHDGVLVMDKLAFSTPGADMQVTAMYKTPRKNHLFVGMDLHMLEIEIHELLGMIPQIDTIMPMLRSFGGKGEFHITVETYLDSLYQIKMSTLRGASSIRGESLVLMDGETFSEIAKMLRFRKKTENKVDSLSAEFTIFRNEIDVYPFLIAMDKYKAVVAGRHNLDMSFDYNISLVASPLPFRVAVNVGGTLEDLKIRLAKSKYPDFYRPVSRKLVESKQVEIRQMIRDELVKRVVQKE